MKTIIIFCSLVALTLGEIDASNKYDSDFKENLHFIHDRHHSQHEQSVSAAKQALQDQLAKLGAQNGYVQGSTQYGNSYGTSGSEKYVDRCATCYGVSENLASHTSRQSSSSNSQQRSSQGVNSDYTHGVGIVGHSSDARYSNDDEDVQTLVGPSYSDSASSRYYNNAHEADDMQQRVVQGDLRPIQSSAYRSRGSAAGSAYQDEDDSQRTVSPDYKPTYGGTVSRIYSQSRDQSNSESSRTGSVAPVTYTSAQQRGSQSESGSGQHINIAVRPGTSTILAVPVRVIQTSGVADDQQQTYSRTSEHSSGSTQTQHPTSTTYRVVYTPSRNYVSTDKISSASQSENSRTSGGVQKPEKLTNYNTFERDSSSQSRVNTEERNSENQVRVAPVYINYPSNGGSSRVASSGTTQGGFTQTRVPVYPVNTVETVSNSRTADEREERRYTPANPTFVSSNRNSESSRTAAERDERRYTPANPTFVSSNRNSESSRTAEERDDRRYTPSNPSFISSSRNTESSQGESRNQVSSGRTTYVAPDRSGSSHQGSSQLGSGGSVYYAPSRAQTQAQQQSSGSQTQSQRQGQGGGVTYTPVYGSSSQRISNGQNTDYLSQRFGTGISSLNTDDLHTYMSESERLARLQQQQIGGSSSGSSQSASDLNRRIAQQATNLDSQAAGFVSGSSLGSRFNEHENSNANSAGNVPGTPGYQHVRSWNKQSKWSSGSEYGNDGQPKTYSTLQTAEAEKHKVNGKEAGYKAATTTLENDGKVSTYSIHT